MIALSDVEATEHIGKALAELLRPGDVVTLSGPLAAGKTTLARAIIAGLGYAGEVPSPSFALVQYYDPPALRLPLAHADLYRLEDPSELAELGLDDMARIGVLLVEWPERAGHWAGDDCLALRIEPGDASARKLHYDAGRNWKDRLTWTRSPGKT